MGGYMYFYFKNSRKTGNVMYQKLRYTKIEGLESSSANLDLNKDLVLKIDPGSEALVLLKQICKKRSLSYLYPNQFLYNDSNLEKLVYEKGEKQQVKINGVAHPEFVLYKGYFDCIYTRLYVNTHQSQTLKVFIKFNNLTNLTLSDEDKQNRCWYFDLKPGQKVLKRLNFIEPFEDVDVGEFEVVHSIAKSTINDGF